MKNPIKRSERNAIKFIKNIRLTILFQQIRTRDETPGQILKAAANGIQYFTCYCRSLIKRKIIAIKKMKNPIKRSERNAIKFIKNIRLTILFQQIRTRDETPGQILKAAAAGIRYFTCYCCSLTKRKIIAMIKNEKTNHPIRVIYSFYNWENRQRPNASILFQAQIIRHFTPPLNGKPDPFEHSHRNFTNPLPCSALFSCGRIIQKLDFCPAKGYIVFEKQKGRTKIPN